MGQRSIHRSGYLIELHIILKLSEVFLVNIINIIIITTTLLKFNIYIERERERETGRDRAR